MLEANKTYSTLYQPKLHEILNKVAKVTQINTNKYIHEKYGLIIIRQINTFLYV